MKFVLAPDSFKESMTAAAAAMSRGIPSTLRRRKPCLT